MKTCSASTTSQSCFDDFGCVEKCQLLYLIVTHVTLLFALVLNDAIYSQLLVQHLSRQSGGDESRQQGHGVLVSAQAKDICSAKLHVHMYMYVLHISSYRPRNFVRCIVQTL